MTPVKPRADPRDLAGVGAFDRRRNKRRGGQPGAFFAAGVGVGGFGAIRSGNLSLGRGDGSRQPDQIRAPNNRSIDLSSDFLHEQIHIHAKIIVVNGNGDQPETAYH